MRPKEIKFLKLKINQVINRKIFNVWKISGHFIQGHVDTTAKIKTINFIDKSWLLKLEISNKNY